MITIVPGKIDDFENCISSIHNSVLEGNYFTESSIRRFVNDGFDEGEILIARTDDGKYAGFMRIDMRGAFSVFPFLRVIAVHDTFRGRNIGKAMISHFEQIGFAREDKVFLVVSELNVQARKLYDYLGYREVGKVQSLFKKDTFEHILMKERV